MPLPTEQIIKLVNENRNNRFGNYQDQNLLNNILSLWNRVMPVNISFSINEQGDLELFLRNTTFNGGNFSYNSV